MPAITPLEGIKTNLSGNTGFFPDAYLRQHLAVVPTKKKERSLPFWLYTHMHRGNDGADKLAIRAAWLGQKEANFAFWLHYLMPASMSSIGTSSSSSSDDDHSLSEGEEHAGGGKEEQLASSVLGDEELGVVSKYAKVNQPCPFSGHTPKHPISLEWRNLNYKVVIPKPPQNLFLRLLLKLPIPDMLTQPLKTKLEVPILNNISGKVAPGNVIAIMGPTGSGKVCLPLLVHLPLL
ncbi:ABC2 type transporter superfamily protein [Balamuthia mandrillaris]